MGFLAQPANVADAQEPLPGIIAIHEWWGLNDNIKAVSERLAGEGYSVLAVDLYGGAVAQQPDQAKPLMQGVMQTPAPAQDNLRQAYAYLTEQQQAPRVGSIGWCFGGAWSLQTGLLLPEQLDAMVIYYGRLETDPKVLAPLQMPIAGFFGELDQGIPVADVKAFEAALTGLGKAAEITIYDDANHAFANPSGDRYNPTAAKDAWDKTTAFFERHLKA
jgi:carboxymethylenebutenolidase